MLFPLGKTIVQNDHCCSYTEAEVLVGDLRIYFATHVYPNIEVYLM